MELFPAIDIRGGRCVRLLRGDYDQETVYGDDPVAVAERFVAAGARWVHVVDLDAARTGDPTNRAVVASIADVATRGGARVQSGGGVRSDEAAQSLLDAGVSRVVLGTAAMEDPELVRRLAAAHPGAVAVGLDTRAGEVAVHGWTAGAGEGVLDVLPRFADAGVAAVIVTEISRDGTLEGPDTSGLREVLDATAIDVIASGGVGSAADLRALAELTQRGRWLAGAIVGKALYEGTVTLDAALDAVRADVS